MTQVNAFTLSKREPEQGIAIVLPDSGKNRLRHPEVQLGTGDRPKWLQLDKDAGKPRYAGNTLLAAQPLLVSDNRFPLLARLTDWSGILVRIVAKDLDFDLIPHANDLSFWAGGESLLHHAIARFGKPSEHEVRDELFAIPDHGYIFVCDRHGSVQFLRNVDQKPFMHPATRAEVVEYIYDYGMGIHASNGGGIQWSVRNLIALEAMPEAAAVGCRNPGVLTSRQREHIRP